MYSKQDRKTWLRATLFMALAAFGAVGFTLAMYDTAAAEPIPCAAPAWATEGSHIPQDAVDEICAIAPPAFSVYNPIHWEVHQKATGTTEYRGP
jgi:hypothetical protein